MLRSFTTLFHWQIARRPWSLILMAHYVRRIHVGGTRTQHKNDLALEGNHQWVLKDVPQDCGTSLSLSLSLSFTTSPSPLCLYSLRALSLCLSFTYMFISFALVLILILSSFYIAALVCCDFESAPLPPHHTSSSAQSNLLKAGFWLDGIYVRVRDDDTEKWSSLGRRWVI